MKRFLYACAVIAVLLIPSCSKEGFSVAGIELSRHLDAIVDSSGSISESRETAMLSVRLSDTDEEVSFRLVSPDGDLSWEGMFADGSASELLLTPGAEFPEGEYSLLLHSENGYEYSSGIEITHRTDKSDFPHFISRDAFNEGSHSVDLELFDSIGNMIQSFSYDDGTDISSEAEKAVFSYIDRYGNMIELTQSFN